MMRDARLCMMAKAPVPGTVKTRLAAAPGIGDELAAELARAFATDTWECLGEVGAPRVLAIDGPAQAFPASMREAVVIQQPHTDLGGRMTSAAAAALAMPGCLRALLVGSDLPGLPPENLRAALAALEDSDVVIGPSEDGGYYAIGFRRVEPGLLSGLPWSAPDTRSRTVERLCQRGYTVAQVDPFDDVDELADLERLVASLRAGRLRAPATEAVLRGVGWP